MPVASVVVVWAIIDDGPARVTVTARHDGLCAVGEDAMTGPVVAVTV